MTDTEVKPVPKSLSYEEVFGAEGPKPSAKDVKPLPKAVSYEDVATNIEAEQKARVEAAKPKPAKASNSLIAEGMIHDENKRLAGRYFTSQSPKKEDYIGDATFDELDDVHIKTAEGGTTPTNSREHLVFKDPEDGKYKVYKRKAENDYGPISGRLVGLGNVVQEGFNAGAPTRLASTAGIATRGQEAVRAADAVADTTGIHVPIPQNMVTDSGVASKLASGLQAIPGGAAPFEKGAAAMEHGIQRAVGEAAGMNTGGAVATAEKAGETARAGIDNYARPKDGIMARIVGNAYDKVDNFIAPNATHDLKNTRNVAQDLQTRFEATGNEGLNPTLKEVLGAVTKPEGLTYDGLKNLRSRVGEMLEGGSSIKDTGVSDKELKALYKGLTDDMRELVTTHGGTRGLQSWEKANNIARIASERREQLGKILGTGRSDEAIFGSLLNKASSKNTADAKSLVLAKKAMPADQWNEIAGAAINRMGRDTNGNFDPIKWGNQYGNLSERGKALLFGSNPRLRKALDNIAKLSKVEELPQEAGQLAQLAAMGATVNHASGGFSNMLHILGGALSGRWLGSMLAKPATAESVAKWMETYKLATLKPTRGNVTLFQRASETLSNEASREDRKVMGDAAKTAGHYLGKLSSLVSPIGPKN